MGILKQGSAQRARIISLAEKRAFEGYLRWGQVPDASAHLKAARELTLKALGDSRPTTHYTWRTAQDERVRSTHAAREGRVFAWTDPPDTGHPGEERNCRCWAEPYYGTPLVSDTSLPLRRQQRFDASGTAVWQSIETLTRPDGSLAESRIVMRDGTRIRSTFNGGLVVNEVSLPDGRVVRLERWNGVQSIYVDGSERPVLQSVWTPDGPRMIVPRRRVAHADLQMPRIDFDDVLRPGGGSVGMPTVEAAKLLLSALSALHEMLQAEPAPLGAGSDAVAALAFRVWTNGDKRNVSAASIAALTAEQVAQSCKILPEVQAWTTEAATVLAPMRVGNSPAVWGTAVHTYVRERIRALKEQFPHVYGHVWAEISFRSDNQETGYGQLDSTRLDVLEELPETICVYDIKTGNAKLSDKRIKRLAEIAARYGKSTFFIVEVRPFE